MSIFKNKYLLLMVVALFFKGVTLAMTGSWWPIG